MSEEFENVGGPLEPTGPTLDEAYDALAVENARLRAALERCQDKFLECARIHRSKIDSSKAILSQEDKENLGKYDRSKAMVQMCEETLKR